MKGQTTISIPSIAIAEFTLKIVGDTSLISERFSEKKLDDIEKAQMGLPKGKKAPKNPEAEYLSTIYYTEDDKPGFPASGIKKACIEACRFVEEVPMTQARGAFRVVGDILPIDGKHRMRRDHVKLKGSITDLRYRAEYPEWSITFTVRHNPNVMTQEAIVSLINVAGFHIGIGGWRASCKNGWHGLFHVALEE